MEETTEAPVVELIPFGSSDLERAGIPFTDAPQRNGDIYRSRVEMPTTVKNVTWKSEAADAVVTAGPVYLDGLALVEIRFAGLDIWSAGWYSQAQARKIAKHFGVTLSEI